MAYTCCQLLYVGSEYEHTYSVYHDHLKVMWDNGGIELMKELGLHEHLLKIEDVPEVTSVASIPQVHQPLGPKATKTMFSIV